MAQNTAEFFVRNVGPVATWSDEEIQLWSDPIGGVDSAPNDGYELRFSKYNPTPGSGRTGFQKVAPNNYPFYSAQERYIPVIQADGGQLSEWEALYNPTKEQAEQDRKKAYETGIPNGYVPRGSKDALSGSINGSENLQGSSTSDDEIQLWVVSEMHDDSEYGAEVYDEEVRISDPANAPSQLNNSSGNGNSPLPPPPPSSNPAASQTKRIRKLHRGGPFQIKVRPSMRVEELRAVIRDVGGIIPALQRLSYGGKHLEDSQRTLQHYGIEFWHKRYPHWPIKIRRD